MGQASAAIHKYLETVAPHVPRQDRFNVQWFDGKDFARGDVESVLRYPHAVTDVHISRCRDKRDGQDHDYRRDELTGIKVYSVRVTYADGAFADASFYDARERDELAMVMRRLQEAATVVERRINPQPIIEERREPDAA